MHLRWWDGMLTFRYCMRPPPYSQIFWFERPPWNRRRVWVLLAVCLFVMDYLSGPYIIFPVLFIPPVLLLSWNGGFVRSASLGTSLCLLRLLFDHAWATNHNHAISFINALLQTVVVLLIAFLTHAIARQTRGLREQVRQLEGILPICSFCKAIRDESGRWQKLERYVSTHSEAHFTHGLCPECMERHYGQFHPEPAAPSVPQGLVR